jgi:hypothetical protein
MRGSLAILVAAAEGSTEFMLEGEVHSVLPFI